MFHFKKSTWLGCACTRGFIDDCLRARRRQLESSAEFQPVLNPISRRARLQTPRNRGLIAGSSVEPARLPSQTGGFDGAKAYEHVANSSASGRIRRHPTRIHRTQDYIRTQLKSFGCAVDEDDFHSQTPIGDVAMKNIVAKIPGDGAGNYSAADALRHPAREQFRGRGRRRLVHRL